MENIDELPRVAPVTELKVKPVSASEGSTKSTDSTELKSQYVIFLSRYAKSILLLFLIVSIGIAYYGFGVFAVLKGDGFNAPNSESAKTVRYFNRFDNVSASSDLIILLSHSEWTVDEESYQEAYFDLKDSLTSSFPLSKIQSFFDYPNESGGLVSVDRHMAAVTAGLPEEIVEYENEPIITIDDFNAAVGDNPLTVTFGGNMLSNEEVDEQIAKDLEKLEFGAFPVLLLLLVIAHEGIVAVSAPVLLSIWTIICTFAALRLVALGFNVTTYATNVTTVFGIGLAMDFSLFTQLRFQEELNRHRDDPTYTPAHAVEKMLDTSGKTVIFSCIMVICTMTAALQFSEYFITTMSLAILFPALFAAIGALTFIPALYIAMGHNLFLLSTRTVVGAFTAWFALNDTKKISASFAPVESQGLQLVDTKSQPSQPTSQDIELGVEEDKQGLDLVSLATDAEDTVSGDPQQAKYFAVGSEAPPALDVVPESAAGDTDSQVKISIRSTAAPLTRAEEEEERSIRNGFWFRMVSVVMKHPVVFLCVMLGCLVALMVVFFTQAKFANQSYGNLPLDSPSRYIIETMQADFPSSNGKSSLEVFMQTTDPLGVRSADFLTLLDEYCTRLQAYSPYVVDVTSMTTIDSTKTLSDYLSIYSDPHSEDNEEFTTIVIDPYALTNLNDVARISISLSIQASDEDLGKVVRYVRHLTATSFYQDTTVDGETTRVNLLHEWGTAGDADQYDLNTDIAATIPNVIAVVLPCVFVFILLLTGSLIMPIKAILTTFLSLCASFGFLVLIIQQGHGSDLLEFHNNLACLDPLQMIFIFLVAFGLSLDYEIFMLGRVQEIYLKTGDNDYSVARGIETSSRSVTMAALLLCTAVGGFLASEILLLKQIGVGIGLTIVIDATFVRCILVPAAMGVMGGDMNWWAPEPIKKVVEYIGLRED